MSRRSPSRPTSVTIICCLLLLGGAIVLFVNAAALLMGQPPGAPDISMVEFAIGMLGGVIAIVCAAFMFRGANWARIVYLAVFGISVFVLLVTPEGRKVAGIELVKFIVCSCVLLTGRANRFFRGGK